MQTIIKLIATFGYIGYLPGPKATIASCAALVLYWIVKGTMLGYGIVTACLLVLGFLVSGRAERLFGKKDAREITIDDACGMLLALFLVPPSLPFVVGAFVLYRAIDILKIPPLRRLENLPGAAGVMLDDVAAGILTNIVIHTVRYIV
jgi:phosphatidylglycerophosphatase A